MYVFVYGTLLKGLERNYVLSEYKYVGEAYIKARLFDLGKYPGINKGDGIVSGELYEIDRRGLDALDRVERYNEKDLLNSLYIREQISTCKISTEESINAYCYFYNQEVNNNIILHGDYRKYRLEKSIC